MDYIAAKCRNYDNPCWGPIFKRGKVWTTSNPEEIQALAPKERRLGTRQTETDPRQSGHARAPSVVTVQWSGVEWSGGPAGPPAQECGYNGSCADSR